MEAKYDSMSLSELKEEAKTRGLKSISSMRKQEIIDLLISVDNKLEELRKAKETKQAALKETQNDTSKKVEQKEISKDTGKKVEPKETSKNTGKGSDIIDNGKKIDKKVFVKKKINETQHKEQIEENLTINENQHKEQIKEKSTINENQHKEHTKENSTYKETQHKEYKKESNELDSGETKSGILEVLPDGYGFIRCDNFLPGENDVYVSPAQIRKFNLKTGDIIVGNTKVKSQNEKFSALLFVKTINGFHPAEAQKRPKFEELTPIFPNKRIRLERPGAGHAMRMVDLVSPVGAGQRGMIVSPPKAGKTTLLKQIAKSITTNYPDSRLIILLIDERPEEVTDIKESIEGKNVEVIYSTFDELPDNHKRVSEMVIERGKRLVEHKQNVVILLDSITRLARAYNLTVQPSGRTLSGGLDPAALHMPKKFFGAARNMREGGSLTILATALVETGSRMDDVVFEEFKGTGNMELVLDRSLSEKRIFPAIDLAKSSTRRDDLLLTQGEAEAALLMRKALSGMKSDEALEKIIDLFIRTKTNLEFIEIIKKTRLV